METLFLNLGYACNCNCLYCVTAGIKEEFNTDEFVAFEQLSKMDFSSYKLVTLTGGEPTIHPRFFQILDFFQQKELPIAIQTNGIMLGGGPFFSQLSKYSVHQVFIPINSYRENTHNTIMRNDHAFYLSVRGVKNCMEAQISITVKIIITSLNYRDLPGTVLFLLKIGVRKFQITYPVFRGNTLRSKKNVPTYSEIRPYLDMVEELNKKWDFWYSLESFVYCMVSERQRKNIFEIDQIDPLAIDDNIIERLYESQKLRAACINDGKKTSSRPCGSCDVQLIRQKFQNISPMHDHLIDPTSAACLDASFKTYVEACKECSHRSICEGIPDGYLNRFGDGEFQHPLSGMLNIEKIQGYITYQKNA